MPPAGPTYADVAKAAERINGIARRTPVLTSTSADRIAGAHLHFKCENFQRTGAFKFRGAFNAIASLDDGVRRRGIVTYSSGNHAQAIALAARLHDVPATIVMPHDAPESKIAATRDFGAEIRFYDRYRENREEIGRRLSQEQGSTLIPPYDHPQVIAGQGTATKELFEDVGPLDVLFVPLGGGGLLSGALLASTELAPRCRVIGVEPEAGNDGQQSLAAGEVITIPQPKSIADGAIVTHLGSHNFPIIQRSVATIETVDDAALVDAMRFLASRMKILVEPTGCLGAAAALSGRFHKRGERVGVMLSGGNIDLPRFASMMPD